MQLEERQHEISTPIPDEIAKQVNQLFVTYYKYGQGKALKELITNKIFGFSHNDQHEAVLLWLRSDFQALLKKLSKKNNAFVPLLLYGFVERDKEKVITVHQKVLQKKLLSEKERMDISSFSLPLWYMEMDQPEKSMQLVRGEMKAIKTSDHGFLPFLTIMYTIILFFQNEMKEAEKSLQRAEQVLREYPFLRETGALKVIQGLFLIKKGKVKNGEIAINEGIEIIYQSGHTYYFFLIYKLLDLLLPRSGASVTLANHYKKEANNYYKRLNLNQLKSEIEQQLFALI